MALKALQEIVIYPLLQITFMKHKNDYEQLSIRVSYNLLINGAELVRRGAGAAICVDLCTVYDDLCFVPFSPVLETGSVLVWKRNQTMPEAAGVLSSM